MRRAAPFILALVVWLLLVWPFESTAAGVRVQWVDVGAGLVFAALVSWVMRDAEGVHLWLNPLRYFWLVVYLVVLFAAIVRANLDVAYRVLHPAMPIRPGIIRARTALKTAAGITALANSITLTPGTMTVMAGEDGTLYIHCINVRWRTEEEATARIVRPFEWFLKRILE